MISALCHCHVVLCGLPQLPKKQQFRFMVLVCYLALNNRSVCVAIVYGCSLLTVQLGLADNCSWSLLDPKNKPASSKSTNSFKLQKFKAKICGWYHHNSHIHLQSVMKRLLKINTVVKLLGHKYAIIVQTVCGLFLLLCKSICELWLLPAGQSSAGSLSL